MHLSSVININDNHIAKIAEMVADFSGIVLETGCAKNNITDRKIFYFRC